VSDAHEDRDVVGQLPPEKWPAGKGGLLEVSVRHSQDADGAQTGGADRLYIPTVSAVVRGANVPVRVCLRLNDSFTTTGGEFSRLIGLGEEYLALGAQGLAFGFLDPNLEVDLDTCAALASALPGVPWTFHQAFDSVLDTGRAWRRTRSLPGLDAVQSGGSPLGLTHGYEELLAVATSDRGVAELLTVSGGLSAEQVPWFARVGVTKFHVAEQVRPGGSLKAYVDPSLVRSWRLLVDSAIERTRPA
jgi:copper homeostasis protein